MAGFIRFYLAFAFLSGDIFHLVLLIYTQALSERDKVFRKISSTTSESPLDCRTVAGALTIYLATPGLLRRLFARQTVN